jgi:hypothetical protein
MKMKKKKNRPPKEGAIILDEDFGIFVKDSQYMQDMVGLKKDMDQPKKKK